MCGDIFRTHECGAGARGAVGVGSDGGSRIAARAVAQASVGSVGGVDASHRGRVGARTAAIGCCCTTDCLPCIQEEGGRVAVAKGGGGQAAERAASGELTSRATLAALPLLGCSLCSMCTTCDGRS